MKSQQHRSPACAAEFASLLRVVLTLCFSAPAVASTLEHRPVVSAWPQPLPSVGPTTPQEMEAFVDGFMSAQMASGPVAGATVAVVKDGKVFFAKGYGYEDVDKQVPVDPAETLFRPGSISKLFTWTAVMQLVEQGKLDLDTDVNTYLTDIKLPATHPAPITLRNIMTHTAGFEDGGAGYLFTDSAQNLMPIRDFLRRHMPARVRPPTTDFSSGANASYSNWATALAGHIVETVSGMGYDQYIEQHIFAPLGMAHSTFREPLPGNLATRLSGGYEFEGGRFERKGFEFIHSIGPAGSLSSTATDMARFMLAYLQDGAVPDGRILKPETVQLMHKRAMSPDPALNGSLLGFYETWINGRRVIGHGGDTRFFHSVLSLLPEAHLGLFASVNTGGQGAETSVALERAFFLHYFPAQLPKIAPAPDANKRNERYAGTYRTLRHSYTAFEKVFSIDSDLAATAMPDGTLLMPDPTRDKPARWVEVGDGVFRKLYTDQFVAFKDFRGGHATALVGDFSPVAAERVAWYETGSFHRMIVVVCAVLFVTTLLSAIRERHSDRTGPRELRWSRRVLGLASALLLVFLIAISQGLLGGGDEFDYHIPTSFYVELALPLLAVPAAAAAIYFAVKLWASCAWSVGARLHYTLGALATVVFLVVLNYWNLLGYRFG